MSPSYPPLILGVDAKGAPSHLLEGGDNVRLLLRGGDARGSRQVTQGAHLLEGGDDVRLLLRGVHLLVAE
eukprot:1194924-Prorocentrum_minimum.AAC.1